MDLVIGVFSGDELLLLKQLQGQSLRDEVHHLLEDLALYLGNLSSAKTVVFHLFGGVVNALQTFTNQWVAGVVFFNLRMNEVVVVVELAGFAKQHIFHSRLESVLDPLQSPKKHKFDGAGLVSKPCRGTACPRRAYKLYIADGSDKLVVD